MFNQANSQILNNFNPQFEDPISLNNQLNYLKKSLVSEIILNNISSL